MGEAMHGTMPSMIADTTDRDRARTVRRRLLWAGLALTIAVIAAYFIVMRQSGSKKGAVAAAEAQATAPPVVTVIVPGSAAVAATVALTGSIAAKHTSPVGIQGEGGMVTQVLVKEGDFVRRGQVLARLDRSVQQQQVVEMDAAIRQSEADAALARTELDRAKALVARGFISKADIDRKTTTRDGAEAKVAVARAQAGQMRARLGRLDVRAPDDGLILQRNVEAGQVVGAGTTALFELAQNGAMEMRGRVAEQDLAALKLGQPAKVTLVGSTDSFNGTVWLIDPTIDAMARQGIVRIALGGDRRLRPGAFARATIASGSASRPQLPQSAVQSDDSGSYVMIVDVANKAQRRRVEVGDVGEGGISIVKGLTGQERVVANAAAFLSPGEKIAPVLRPASNG